MKVALLLITATVCFNVSAQYWEQRTSLFEILPVDNNDIIFLGNSITDGGEFSEIFKNPNIKNRGINSDTVDGIAKRLNQITRGKPAKIFLLIGINDVSHNLSAEAIAAKYAALVDSIHKQSPETKLYIQSVMPINNDYKRYKALLGREKVIPQLNRRLKEIASEFGDTYIDLWPALADSNGKMRREYTNDGLHLTGKGYTAWTNLLKPYVEE